MNDINGVELTIVVILFLVVTVMGFAASRWQQGGKDQMHLDEWGLGGRSFGSWITWFLLGGDLYTAYTFVAVPALMFGAGAAGFFAVPYTVVIYPLVFLVVIRLWSVSHVRGFVTPADFVRSRFDSPTMALLVAITGIVATMPYIALQLVGISAILKSIGFAGTGLVGELPLLIAFLVLALYTYNSGLRAPALIAFVKDALIYLTIIVAVIVIPSKLGGWGHIFGAAQAKFSAAGGPGVLLPASGQLGYATLALGSALALFLYPHSITGVLAASNRDVLKRNMSALPVYSFALGLIALLGYMAIAAKHQADRHRHQHDRAGAVPADVPELVRRDRVLGDRDRRAGARGDHVDRGGEPVHPQHLQGVPEEGRHAAAGGPGRQDHLAGGQARRGRGDHLHRPAVLDRPAADRRRDHPADPARRSHWASTPAGCTGARSSPAGRPGWSSGSGCSTRSRSSTRRRTPWSRSTSAARRSPSPSWASTPRRPSTRASCRCWSTSWWSSSSR